jgi:hypothetical protein
MDLMAQAPSGWKVRIDKSTSATDPDNSPDVKFMTMGKGFHVIGGPAGTFWNPANVATGAFNLKATFTLNKPSGHVNYYGLFFGGSELEGPNQAYVYFLVAQDGSYTIRKRMGDKVEDITGRSKHFQIKQPDATGKSVNVLEVRVAPTDAISFIVNGFNVDSAFKTTLGAKTDGLVGFRINHQLDVQVDEFSLSKP